MNEDNRNLISALTFKDQFRWMEPYKVAAQVRFCQGHLGRYGYYRTCQTNNVFVDILRKNELE